MIQSRYAQDRQRKKNSGRDFFLGFIIFCMVPCLIVLFFVMFSKPIVYLNIEGEMVGCDVAGVEYKSNSVECKTAKIGKHSVVYIQNE